MYPTALILGLVATASAIDITLCSKLGCGGIKYVFANRNPNQCVQNGENWSSVRFSYIPTDWNIRPMIYKKKGCDSGSLWAAGQSNGSKNVCMNVDKELLIRGAKYQFVNKRRSVGDAGEEEAVQEGGECRGPDLLILEDGTAFNVANLEPDALSEMTALALNGTAMPEHFLTLKTDVIHEEE